MISIIRSYIESLVIVKDGSRNLSITLAPIAIKINPSNNSIIFKIKMSSMAILMKLWMKYQ